MKFRADSPRSPGKLYATPSVARLLLKQGHRDEARAPLSEVYGWFTEGFDTADLKVGAVSNGNYSEDPTHEM